MTKGRRTWHDGFLWFGLGELLVAGRPVRAGGGACPLLSLPAVYQPFSGNSLPHAWHVVWAVSSVHWRRPQFGQCSSWG